MGDSSLQREDFRPAMVWHIQSQRKSTSLSKPNTDSTGSTFSYTSADNTVIDNRRNQIKPQPIFSPIARGFNPYHYGNKETAQSPAPNAGTRNRKAGRQTKTGEELKAMWNRFTQDTTIHGVKQIGNCRRRRLSRVVWLVLVFIMASVLGYTVGNLLLEYYQYNTVTKAEMKIMTSWPFPSVTVCNLCPFNKKDNSPTTKALGKLLAASSTTSLTDKRVVWNTSESEAQKVLKTPLFALYKEYSYMVSDFIIAAWFNGERLNVSERFEATDTMHGRCFTFNGPQYIKDHGIVMTSHDGRRSGLQFFVNINQDGYFIYEDITAGVRMYISQHPQTPRIKNDGIDISPGTSTRVSLQPITYSFLPRPYRSYGEQQYCERLPERDVDNRLVNATFYSYERCLDQCMLKTATINCSCTLNVFEVSGYSSCTFGDYYTCILPFIEKFRQFDAASCDCPRPCTFIKYLMTTSSSQMPSKASATELKKWFNNTSSMAHFRENYLNIRVYMGSMLAKSERHEPQYTIGSIVAFLGGQMGFFLGASLITMAELIETLIETGLVLFLNKVVKIGQLRPQQRDNIVKAWVG